MRKTYVFTLRYEGYRSIQVLKFKHQWLAYVAAQHFRKRFWYAETEFKRLTLFKAVWYALLVKIRYYEPFKN